MPRLGPHLNTTLTSGEFSYMDQKKIIMVYHQHCINLLLINISNHVLHCYNYCVPVLVSLLMLFVFYLASLKEYSLQYIIYNNINNMPLCDLLIDKKCRIECRSSDLWSLQVVYALCTMYNTSTFYKLLIQLDELGSISLFFFSTANSQ